MAAALLPILFSFFYGGLRVATSHPHYNNKYAAWLATSPWTYGKPLPLGPIRLVWEDLLVVAFLVIAAVLPLLQVDPAVLADQSTLPQRPWGLAGVVCLAFLLGRLLCLTITILSSDRFIIPILFIAPLIVYPHFNFWIGLAVMLVIYLIVAAGVRWNLARFPWDSPQWKTDSRELMLDDVLRAGLIGWPYSTIGPTRPNKNNLGFPTAILISAFLAWWTFVLTHGGLIFIESTGYTWQELASYLKEQGEVLPIDAIFWLAWGAVVVVVAGARILAYLPGTRPPISILGRFATGRLIVPGYDKIFIAPIVLLAYGWAGPNALIALGLPPISIPAVSLFGLLMLSMTLGPSMESWRFTGHHRVRPWGTPTPANTSRRGNRKSPGSIQINLPGLTR